MVFHCSLSDSMSPQIFRTFPSIVADVNNAEVLVNLYSSTDLQLLHSLFFALENSPKH